MKTPWEKVGRSARRDMKRASILVDLRRCTGCHACSVSCKTEHTVPLGEFRMRVRYLEPPAAVGPQLAFVPMLCMHCQDAPCMDACTPGALVRQSDGRVVVDSAKCTADGSCVSACPYGAIYLNEHTGKAEKCDLCQNRTEVGLDPACVTACPTDALVFHDADDPNDPATARIAALDARAWKPEEKTRPTVLYVAHDKWMERKAGDGVRMSETDADIIYEQDNLDRIGKAGEEA